MSVGFNSYDDFKQYLEDSGLKTTRINSERGEANFFDYGAALSDDLQDMICNPNKYNLDASDDATDGFDENDKQLQAEIAALFKNKSVMQRGDFVATLKSMGYDVSVSYVKTSYISDNKADGHYDTDVRNGNIGVYTISDGKGGDLIIADANGNGALEVEEVMMNHILDGVNADVMADIKARQGISGISGSSSGSSNEAVKETEKEEEISQSEFNSIVEKYLEQGYGESLAESLANGDVDSAKSLNYTGTFEAVQAEEEAEGEVTQESFNKQVNSYISEGKSIEEATAKANEDLGVDMEYTGSEKDKVEEKEAA